MAQLLRSEFQVAVSVEADRAADSPACKDGYKTLFDITFLSLSFIIGFPLWLLAWVSIPLAIWLTDRGPVFYTQERLGKDGRRFRLIKFRTMVVNAESLSGPVLASESDLRVTRLGRLLRRTHLDEMPQVINVFRGEMSLVGPRPERPELFEECCKEAPSFRLRLGVKPGIAGLAQVQGGYHISPRNKLRYDKLYIENLGPWTDLTLFLQSLWVAILPPSTTSPREIRQRRTDGLVIHSSLKSGKPGGSRR